jgi:hypothetical protein
MDFVKEEYKPTPTTCFTLDNIEYCCEEELVNQKFEDFVSIQTAIYNYRNDKVRVLPRLLAILCKRKDETLDDFNISERSKLMETCPMTKAKDVEAFFLSSLTAYNALTLISSTQDIQKEMVLHKIKELENTMRKYKAQTGISFGTKIRIGVYQIQLWWVKNQLVKYFSLQPTKDSKMTWKQTCKKLLTRKLKGKSNGKV